MDPLTLGLAGAGFASQIFGGIKSAQANKAARAALDKQIEENQAIYNNNVNRTFLDTAAAKGALERIRKQYERSNDIAESRGVVTGATPEAVIAEKSENNEALNDATSRIAEQGTAYQDSQTNQYRQTANQLTGAKIALDQQKAENAANLVSNAGNLLGSAAMLGEGETSALASGGSGKGSLNDILSHAKNAGVGAAITARGTNGQGLALNTIANQGTDAALQALRNKQIFKV